MLAAQRELLAQITLNSPSDGVDYAAMLILLVTRCPGAWAAIRERLEKYPAVRVLEATSGAHALQVLLEHPVDLVVTELDLPDFDGARLLGLGRSACWDSDPGFVAVTSAAARRRAEELFDRGAVDVLSNPLDAEGLPARLHAHAQQAAARRAILKRIDSLEMASATDELTGLGNRRAIMNTIDLECARSVRYSTPLAVALADIDHFKTVNDVLGHAAGDQVLRELARLTRRVARRYDHVGRYGGEEFLFVVPHTGESAAAAFCRRLQDELSLRCFTDHRLRVTLSFGVAASRPACRSAAQLLAAADEALYVAKSTGRNRVTTASEIARLQAGLPCPSGA
jgi:diguanylate cyclase (GGDEF)-like protein